MKTSLVRILEDLRDVPWWLRVLGLLFLVVTAYLVVGSLHRPDPLTFRPTTSPPGPAGDSLSPVHTVTLDAREEDQWVGYDFSLGRVTALGDPVERAEGWDLAASRYHVIVNGGAGYAGRGAAADLGRVAFDSVRRAPRGGWMPTAGDGPNPVHPTLSNWYRYDFLSHLLSPRPRVYAVRTAEGEYAKVEFLSYYCPGPVGGCVTFRYRYQGDGSRRLEP